MTDIEMIIKIPEYLYEAILEYPNVSGLNVTQLESAILHGTPIPDNATNGEVIKVMFEPNINKRHNGEDIEAYYFDAVWWNSPYQKGDKE